MKKNIALVAGGYSGEYDISIKSSLQVLRNIDQSVYNVFLVIIKKESWMCVSPEDCVQEIDRKDFSILRDGQKFCFDAAMIVIHGTPGEDGKLQGYFDMLNIPYTTCSQDVSSATFNKYFCKLIVSSFGLPTANFFFYTKHTPIQITEIIDALAYPVFVKPNKNGSSVGVSKAHNLAELDEAITNAFAADDEILVEETIVGREITCGILRDAGELVALPVTEIISKKEFFDYEAKYTPGMAEEVVPADIDEETALRCQEISRNLYTRLNCSGVVRFDYILSDDTFYFLEVNTVPGLSEGSIVPKMVRAFGWTEKELYGKLIENALNPVSGGQ